MIEVLVTLLPVRLWRIGRMPGVGGMPGSHTIFAVAATVSACPACRLDDLQVQRSNVLPEKPSKDVFNELNLS